MPFLELLISLLAPHHCLGCQAEGALLCRKCSLRLQHLPERCYRCRKLSTGGRTCKACRRTSKLYAVLVGLSYEGLVKDTIWQFKFHSGHAADKPLARLMLTRLQQSYDMVVPVPTATLRTRQRGYDQAVLLARELGSLTGFPVVNVLHRSGQAHQVGASRRQRLEQLKRAFWTHSGVDLTNKHILLVDDVVTTGATLEAAAEALKAAGAAKVSAVVVAQA